MIAGRIIVTGKMTVHFISPSLLRMARGNKERKAKGWRKHIRRDKAKAK